MIRSIAALSIVALLATGAAFAQGPRGDRGFGGRGIGGPGGAGLPLQQLNLTDAQREQIRDIRARHREQSEAAAQRLAELTRKQRAAIEAIPVNETLITSLTQDMTAAQVELALQQARLNADVWSVLTSEQQAQATKLRAEREARMAERRERLEQRRQNRQ